MKSLPLSSSKVKNLAIFSTILNVYAGGDSHFRLSTHEQMFLTSLGETGPEFLGTSENACISDTSELACGCFITQRVLGGDLDLINLKGDCP